MSRRCSRPLTSWLMAAVGLIALMAPVRADNWPQWRGPGGQGVSTERALPLEWAAEAGTSRGRRSCPGAACRRRSVRDDLIFVTAS